MRFTSKTKCSNCSSTAYDKCVYAGHCDTQTSTPYRVYRWLLLGARKTKNEKLVYLNAAPKKQQPCTDWTKRNDRVSCLRETRTITTSTNVILLQICLPEVTQLINILMSFAPFTAHGPSLGRSNERTNQPEVTRYIYSDRFLQRHKNNHKPNDKSYQINTRLCNRISLESTRKSH